MMKSKFKSLTSTYYVMSETPKTKGWQTVNVESNIFKQILFLRCRSQILWAGYKIEYFQTNPFFKVPLTNDNLVGPLGSVKMEQSLNELLAN